nr:hypothetical protein [Tanacetum cinerariifolium]
MLIKSINEGSYAIKEYEVKDTDTYAMVLEIQEKDDLDAEELKQHELTVLFLWPSCEASRQHQDLNKLDIDSVFDILKHNKEDVNDIREELKNKEKPVNGPLALVASSNQSRNTFNSQS